MKKSLLFISALVAGASGFAQQITNGGFEMQANFAPSNWSSTVNFTAQGNPAFPPSVTVSDTSYKKVGSHAIVVHSAHFNGTNIVPGISISGPNAYSGLDFSNYPTITTIANGSISYTATPTAIPKTLSGFARYRTVANGSNQGAIGIQIFSGGNVVGYYVNAAATGTIDANVFPVDTVAINNGYVNFNMPITTIGNPTTMDSVRITLTTTLPSQAQAQAATMSDTLFVDQLRFLSCTPDSTVTLANAGITSDDGNSGISDDGVLILPYTSAGASYDHTFTISVPDPSYITRGGFTFTATPVDSMVYEAIGNLPGSLTYALGESSGVVYGNSIYCFTISGNLPATTPASYKWMIKQTPYGKLKYDLSNAPAPYNAIGAGTTNMPNANLGGFYSINLSHSSIDSIMINIAAAPPATPTITLTGNVLTSSAATGNQWYKNGSPINAATAQTYTVTQAGDYTDIVTISNVSSAVSNTITLTTPATPTITPNAYVLTSSASTGNQWYMNGAAINGATADTYTATAAGNYHDVVTVSGVASAPSNTLTVTGPPAATVTAVGHVLTSSSSTGNQWYLGSTPISGATAQTYTATANGNYTVKVTVSGIASAASNTTVINDFVTGIAVTTVDNAVAVFPNPTTGAFSVRSASKIVSVDVVNTIGSVVSTQQVNAATANLDLSKEQNGVYFVKIISENGISTVKVVLSK